MLSYVLQNNFVNLTSVYKKDDDEKLIRLNLSPWNFEILQSKLDYNFLPGQFFSNTLYSIAAEKKWTSYDSQGSCTGNARTVFKRCTIC